MLLRKVMVFTSLLLILPLPIQLLGQDADSAEATSTLRGTVTDGEGNPLSKVRVRIAIPRADMRFVNPGTEHQQQETTTDVKGQYELVVNGITEPTKISIDAMKPKFQRLSGTLMMGGKQVNLTVKPNETSKANFSLKPSSYVRGQVVDDAGEPIARVSVSADSVTDRSSGGVERTVTDKEGIFEIFNYTTQPFKEAGNNRRGRISFFHANYLGADLRDVYEFPEELRTELQVVLPAGRRIAGKIIAANGKPAANVMLKAMAGLERKTTMTNALGEFELAGLAPGAAQISCLDFIGNQKVKLSLDLQTSETDLKIQLEAIELPDDMKTYSFLGLQVTDMTPELKEAYEIFYTKGVLVLDPGKDANRLAIGKLAKGDVFWMVGQRKIGSTAEFVGQLVREAAGGNAFSRLMAAGTGNAGGSRVRVVYGMTRLAMDGTNTQHMRLTKQDVAELKKLNEELASEVVEPVDD